MQHHDRLVADQRLLNVRGGPLPCFMLQSTAKGGGTIVRILLFTARKNIDDYWMNLFMSNSEIHRHHAQDVLDSFQNCVLNNKQSDYSFKTLSLFHRLNFVYYPTPEVAKLCQTTCQKFGLLKSRPKMLVEVQKVLNLHGRRRGDYYR